MENTENEFQSIMEDTIPAKDRVIAWPRMGRIDIPLKALLLSLGAR